MKTIKPMQLSVLHRSFEYRGRKLFGLSVLTFLTLDEEPTLLLEADLWSFLAETLGEDAALETGIPKSVSEFLVFGSAHAPGQKPVPALAARARFGLVDKPLIVHGDRYWDDREPTAAQTFTAMPLDWSRSYGGPGFPHNPAGKGHAPVEINGVSVRPLPNIEYPNQQPQSPKDAGVPAGFGLVDLTLPQRMELAGTYDDAWLKTRYPGMADDTNWRYFNVAPRDQWIEGPIPPDEAYEFTHLHPTREVISGRLPDITCRAFIRRTARGPDDLKEIKLDLRTAAFFPDRERVVLIHQGWTPITDEHAADISHLMVGADAAGAVRSVDYYRAVLGQRLDPDKGLLYALRDGDLMPQGLKRAALTSTPANDDPSLARGLKRAERKIQESRALVASYGLAPDEHAPVIPKSEPQPAPKPEEMLEFIDKQLAESDALVAEQKKWAAAQDASVAAIMKDAGQDFTLIEKERSQGQVGPPQFKAESELDSLRKISREQREAGQPADELDGYLADPVYTQRLHTAEKQLLEAYRMSAHIQSPAPRLAEDIAAALKQRLAAAHSQGIPFARRNFTGGDMSGLDLRGADFSGALLERTDFSGAQLQGCNFSHAVLAHATLDGAVFDRADLSGANLGKASLRKASLREARLVDAILADSELAETTFSGADLSGADLAGIRLLRTDFSQILAPDAIFNEVDLAGAILRGARMPRSIFLKCSVAGADFSNADLSSAAFVEVNAERANFREAILVRTVFTSPARLAGADFTDADLSLANLREANLRGARFQSAVLRGADLSGADLQGSFFYMADARGARFVKSDLSLAVLASSNLMDAVLERARLPGSDLRYTNLFRADLARVIADDATQWRGCNAKKARLYPRLRPEEVQAQ